MTADEGISRAAAGGPPVGNTAYPVLFWVGRRGFRTLFITTNKLIIGGEASAHVKLQDPLAQHVRTTITRQDQSWVVEVASGDRSLVVEGNSTARQTLRSGLSFEIGIDRFWFFERITPLASNLTFALDFTSGSRQWQLIDIKDRARIGRSGPEITLADDSGVSGQHAEIRCLGMELAFISDLGSSNGTFVNGEEIDGRAFRLYIGDEVQVGQARFNLRLRKREGAPEPPVAGLLDQKTDPVVPASPTELADAAARQAGREVPRDLQSQNEEPPTERYPVRRKRLGDKNSPPPVALEEPPTEQYAIGLGDPPARTGGEEPPTERYPVVKTVLKEELPTERFPSIDDAGPVPSGPLSGDLVSALVARAADEEEELSEMFRQRDTDLERTVDSTGAATIQSPPAVPSTPEASAGDSGRFPSPSPGSAPHEPLELRARLDHPAPVAEPLADQAVSAPNTAHIRSPRRGGVPVVGILIILLVVVAAGLFFLRSRSTTGPAASQHSQVPRLTQLPLITARNMLRERGLVLHEKPPRSDPAAAEGTVIHQSISAGSLVERGTVVEVVASAGPAPAAAPEGSVPAVPKPAASAPAPIIVPELARLSLAEAKNALTRAGLRAGATSRRVTRALPNRHVISSVPAAGERVVAGTPIKLVISSDSSEAIVPRLIGAKERVARKKLELAGLKLGKVRYKYDDRRPGLVILKQSPGPGAAVARGTAVNLMVNEGD